MRRVPPSGRGTSKGAIGGTSLGVCPRSIASSPSVCVHDRVEIRALQQEKPRQAFHPVVVAFGTVNHRKEALETKSRASSEERDGMLFSVLRALFGDNPEGRRGIEIEL